jgi:hypothetical protein
MLLKFVNPNCIEPRNSMSSGSQLSLAMCAAMCLYVCYSHLKLKFVFKLFMNWKLWQGKPMGGGGVCAGRINKADLLKTLPNNVSNPET